MSGVAIVRNLLANYAPLLALLPKEKIFAGHIPQGTALPAIGVSEVYTREIRATTRNATTKTSRARIQVTVLTSGSTNTVAGYAQLKNIIKAAGLGPGVHTHLYQGAGFAYNVKAVEPDGIGPEIPPADDKIYEQSRDFIVTFAEPN